MLRNSYLQPYHENVNLHHLNHGYVTGAFIKNKQEPKGFFYFPSSHQLERAPPCKSAPQGSTSVLRNGQRLRSIVSQSPGGSCSSTGTDSCDQDAMLQLQPGMSEVPSWLKSLRLHKYKQLFATLSYEQMLNLTEQQLEQRNVTKGARHKIIVNIEKLKSRQPNLANLEKCLHLEGVSGIRQALGELKMVLHTPIKAFAGNYKSDSPSDTVIEGDLPGQIVHLLEKIHSLLQIESFRDEESIALYLTCLDKCLSQEAFTSAQKQKLIKGRSKIEHFKNFLQQKKWNHNGNALHQLPTPAHSNFMTTNLGTSSQITTNSSSSQFQRSYQKFGSLNEPCTWFEQQFGKITTDQSNGKISGQARDPKHFSYQTNNSRSGNVFGNSNENVLSRPASVCSDRNFCPSTQNPGQSILNVFNDHPMKSFESGCRRNNGSSNFESCLLHERQQIQKQHSKQTQRLGSESPELLISSNSSSSSRSSTESGGGSSSASGNEFTTRLLPLVSSEIFNVCTQIGAQTRSDRSQFGVLDPVGSYGGGLNRLNSFVYGDHTQLDMGPFKSKDSDHLFGADLHSVNSMNTIMNGLERAGALRSGHFAEHGKDHHDEQLDENNQLYSHIELLSLQMTEQALESSDFS